MADRRRMKTQLAQHISAADREAGSKSGPPANYNGRSVRLVVGHGLTPVSKPRPSAGHVRVTTPDGNAWWVAKSEIDMTHRPNRGRR